MRESSNGKPSSHEAAFALCPVLTILCQPSPAVLHRNSRGSLSCLQRQPQLQLPPESRFQAIFQAALKSYQSRPRKTFSHILSPPSYNRASRLLPSSLSFKVKFRKPAKAMSD